MPPRAVLTSGSERTAARRMRELGGTLESVVRSDGDVAHVLDAAHGAFRAQASWNADEQRRYVA